MSEECRTHLGDESDCRLGRKILCRYRSGGDSRSFYSQYFIDTAVLEFFIKVLTYLGHKGYIDTMI